MEKYTYDVYGNTTIKSPTGSTRSVSSYGNRFMFTGREYDTETGNYYYRARYYSPTLGRFLQMDTIRTNVYLNLYHYCLNNPFNYVDPSGLWPEGIHNQIIQQAYPNLSQANITAIQNGSIDADTHQQPYESYMHAMTNGTTNPPQTAQIALILMNKYIRNNMNLFHSLMDSADKLKGKARDEKLRQAYEALGHALHPVMDSTSPPHAGFMPWNGFGHPVQALGHAIAEQNAQAQMNETVNLMHNYYNP